MALFGRKNKKNNPTASSPDIHDDIDIFDALDSEPDLSATEYPSHSYEDFEGKDIPDDILGIDDQKPVKKEPEKKSKVGVIIAVAAAVLIGGTLIFATMTGDDQGSGGDNTAQEEEINSQVEGSTEGIVVNEELGVAYEGNDNGAPVNGTGAILAFDHSYYVDRDGEKVMEHFNPETTSYDSAFIQSHIDKIPGGTTYKLEVTPRQVGVSYDVILTLNIPGENPVQYQQNFETMQEDGEYFVKTFTSSRL